MGVDFAKAALAAGHAVVANEAQPPRRFIAGADATAIAKQKAADLQSQPVVVAGIR